MKISEAFDLYKRNFLTVKHYSRRVIESNDYVKRKIIEAVGDKELADFSLDDVATWAHSMETIKLADGSTRPRKTNSIRSDANRLRAVIKYMELTGEKCINYQLIPVPKHEDVEIGFLYEKEVQAMIDNAYNLRNKFVISLLYSSGIRLSEMLALNRDSINDRTFTVIGKGHKARICFIDERTEELMEEYLASRDDDCPALIVSAIYKQRMTPTNVQLLIRNSAKRAGIERRITPHMLRHSFATNFMRNNGNMRYLSHLLGHSSISTTMIYTHVVDNDLRGKYEQFHSV